MEPDRQSAIGDIDNYLRVHLCSTDDDTQGKEYLFGLFFQAELLLKNGENLPPTLLLEIFIWSHSAGLPTPPFILHWLYSGALAFHQAEGQEHFERGLGFTSGQGRWSGQGNEFTIARRKNLIDRENLYHWVWCLNKIERFPLSNSIEIVHLIHEHLLPAKRSHRKCLTDNTLERGYKSWQGKRIDKGTERIIRHKWKDNRDKWFELFKKLEIPLPTPKGTPKGTPAK